MTNQNTVAQNSNVTIADVQASHMEAIKQMTFKSVHAHEMFGLANPLKGLEQKMMVAAEAHPLAPTIDTGYVFNENLLRRVMLSMSEGDSILLVGDKGTGKSSLVQQLHARLGKPLVSITAGPGVDESYLLGSKTIDKGEVKSFDGVLSYAYRHGLSCLIDELCALRPGVLVSVNDILQGDPVVTLKHHGIDPSQDPRKLLELSGGMNIVKHPMFKLFGTDNTGGKASRDPRFAGSNGQNSAVRSRFTSFKVGFMSPENEMKALANAANSFAASRRMNRQIDETVVRSMVEFAFNFRKAFSLGEAFDNVSFREIRRWGRKYLNYANDLDESFVDAIYTNLEESDQQVALSLFKDTMGRELILPEEYSVDVSSVADVFSKGNIAAAA